MAEYNIQAQVGFEARVNVPDHLVEGMDEDEIIEFLENELAGCDVNLVIKDITNRGLKFTDEYVDIPELIDFEPA